VTQLIALDLGMTVGLASGSPDARPDFGSFKLTPCKGDYGALMTEYGGKLIKLITPGTDCMVGYEGVILHRNNSMHAQMILCGLACETERICYRLGIPYTSYPPMKVKQVFSGHGWSKKDSMMARAKQLGFPVKLSHEADAIGVWYCLVAFYDRQNKTNYLSSALDPLFGRKQK